MPMVASLRGVALLPAYAKNFMPWSVTGKVLKGRVPVIELVVGYGKGNDSTVLKQFLPKLDDLIESKRKA